MRKSFVVVFALSVVGAVATACSSSSGLGLGDDTLAPPNDSGTDSTVGPTPDGSTPIGDGSTPTLDAGSDARAEPDCTGLAYCENFEAYEDAGALKNGGTLGPWSIQINVPADAGSPEPMGVDTVNPYGGLRSLHIQVPNNANSSTHLLNLTKASGLVGNDLYGRMMVYYKGAKPNGHTWTWQGIGASSESGDPSTSLNVANEGNDYFVNYHGTAGDSTAETSDHGGVPVVNAWVCLQWEYNASGAPIADDVKVWADGTVIIDSKKAPIQAWQLPDPVTQMQLGWVHYPETTEAIDLYIDDFALNNAMIACPP
jgi:hypothetical protein